MPDQWKCTERRICFELILGVLICKYMYLYFVLLYFCLLICHQMYLLKWNLGTLGENNVNFDRHICLQWLQMCLSSKIGNIIVYYKLRLNCTNKQLIQIIYNGVINPISARCKKWTFEILNKIVVFIWQYSHVLMYISYFFSDHSRDNSTFHTKIRIVN